VTGEVSEELQGTDLRQAVLTGVVGPEAAVPLMFKLASALAASAGEQPAAPRPRLEPRHIRVDDTGEPLVLEGSIVPPPAQGDPDGARRDVFGLGITGLFVLRRGHLPPDVLSRLDALIAELDCPPALAATLRRACAPDPAERFATVAELRDALADSVRTCGPYAARMSDPVEDCQLLLRQDPTRLDPYRRLFELYRERGAADRAYCVARALVFLERADATHREFHAQHARTGPIRPRAAVDEERWVKDLMHPGEDLLLGRVLAAITPAVIELRKQGDRALGLRADQQVRDVEGSTITIARSFGFVARVLSLPALPRLFLCPEREGGLAHAHTRPPASVCGKGVLSGVAPVDLTFIVTKHLADCRAEHYVRTLLRADDLSAALAVAKRLAGFDAPVPDLAWLDKLERKVDADARAHLRQLRERFPRFGELHDVQGWLHAVELTAYRAGLLLCDDLVIAARMASADPRLARYGLTAHDVLRELLVFSVSEQCFRLREHLGIAIGAS
jgi:hypothetical protein